MSGRKLAVCSLAFSLGASCLISCSPKPKSTQPEPAITWEKTLGGAFDDYGNGVALTSDGGYVVAGARCLSGEPIASVIEKVDASGSEVWNRTLPSSCDQDGGAVCQTADGGFGVVTCSALIRLTAAGDVVWQKTLSGGEEGHSVTQCLDGGFMITGFFFSGSDADVYLLRTDAAGKEIWHKTFGGSDTDVGNSVAECGDGGFIVAGYTMSFGAGSNDVYLLRTDAAGKEIWHKTFGGSDTDVGNSVAKCGDGGFIVAGATLSFGAGASDVYLLRIDEAGNEVWHNTFGGGHFDFGSSVAPCLDGGFIVAGATLSFGKGGKDVYLIRADETGKLIWHKTFGGLADDDGNSVAQCPDGGFIIAGSTESLGAGGADVYLIKTDENGELSQ